MAKMDDKEIMLKLLEELNIKAFTLSKNIGYKQPSSVYHVIDGTQGISPLMIVRITENYPVNPDFLRRGDGPVLLKKPLDVAMSNLGQSNDYTINDIPNLLAKLVSNTDEILKKLNEDK